MAGIITLMMAGVLMVLVLDSINGPYDAVNMLATIVTAGATMPIGAALLVSCSTFLRPILGEMAIVNTIGSVVDVTGIETIASMTVVLPRLAVAIAWNVCTWWFGPPASSSLPLVGDVAVVAGSGHVFSGLVAPAGGPLTGVTKISGALLASTAFRFQFGWMIYRMMGFALCGARLTVNRYIRGSQWLTTAAQSQAEKGLSRGDRRAASPGTLRPGSHHAARGRQRRPSAIARPGGATGVYSGRKGALNCQGSIRAAGGHSVPF
ncbi:MAG: inorganic phosphate transporter [Hyphomicrobiaceae bacterium]